MRIAYGDLISGISGDMMVGALLDAGLPLRRLKAELKKIPSLDFRVEVSRKMLHGIEASHFHVICRENEPERSWRQIGRLLRQSPLAPAVRDRAVEIFGRLAEAEGRIHGVPPERVHFHEVGATDSIVDIAATAIGISYLEIDSIFFSRVPLGRGITRARHGSLPLPGPATLELLKGAPIEGVDIVGETVTPTGAAIVSTLASGFGELPAMRIEKIGYGSGTKEFPDRPNVLRLVVGQSDPGWRQDDMLLLETNIDDMNPEIYDHVLDRLFDAGARDVFLQPIQMKKNRPGILLRILAEPRDRDRLAAIVFRETSTIGIRFYPVRRMILKRSIEPLQTRFGRIHVKVVEEPDGATRAAPEYDDLKRLARDRNIPMRILYDEVARSFPARPARKKR